MAPALSRELIDLSDREALRRRAPLLAAHRGAVGPGAPENSLAALEGAAVMGFDLAEIDIEATRDAVPVLFHHDPEGTMRQACGVAAAVGDLAAAELRTVRHRASNQVVPTLDEALAHCAARRLGVVLDPKASARRRPVLERIADLLDRHRLTRAAMLLCEEPETRRALAGRATLVVTRDDHARALAGDAVSMARQFWPGFADQLSAEEVAALRRSGALILATVDARRYPAHAHRELAQQDIGRLRVLDVDVFLTDALYRDLFDGA